MPLISPPALLVTLPIVPAPVRPLSPEIVPELASVRTEVPAARLTPVAPLMRPLLVNVPTDPVPWSPNPTPPLDPAVPLLEKAPSVALAMTTAL